MRSLFALVAALFVVSPVAVADEGGNNKQSYRWDKEPFIQPIVGGRVFSDGVNSYFGVNLGARAGLMYQQDKPGMHLAGMTRAQATATLGSLSGVDLRLGSFLGPWMGPVGFQAGPDFFWNRYSFGGAEIPATLGMTWQNHLLFDAKAVQLVLGADPDFFFSDDRERVDWSEQSTFGFGHEMSYLAGIRLLIVGASITHRITAYGTENLFSLGVSI